MNIFLNIRKIIKIKNNFIKIKSEKIIKIYKKINIKKNNIFIKNIYKMEFFKVNHLNPYFLLVFLF